MIKTCVPYKFWCAALECAASDDIRYYLNGIHLNKNCIESTNGHTAYKAEFKMDELDGEKVMSGQFVGAGKFSGYTGELPNVIIGKLGSKPSKSIQNKTVWLLIEEQEEGELLLKYIDSGFNVVFIQSAEIINAKFPDINRVMPKGKRSREQFNIGLNPEYLALPARILALEKNNKWNGTVVIKAWDNSTAVTFEIKRVSGECLSLDIKDCN